ncbi:ankyrin repeat-containing domain protein [Aspergillus venezuelensis]
MRQQYGRMCYSGHDITIDEFTSACAAGEYTRIQKLLDEGLPPQIGRHRPLMVAINCDEAEIAKLLLTRGANDECRAVSEGEWEWPPKKSDNTRSLQFAAMQGRLNVVESLLALGRVNCPDAVGRTALHFAARFGRCEVVGLLVDAGADALLVDEDGRTALDYAVAAGHTQIVEFLKVIMEKERAQVPTLGPSSFHESQPTQRRDPSSTPMAKFHDLPSETVLEIARYYDNTALFRFLRTCKELHELCKPVLYNQPDAVILNAIKFDQSEALDLLLETTSNTMGSALQHVNDYNVYVHGVATAQVNLHHRTDPQDTHYRQLRYFLANYTGDRSLGGDLNISLLSWASRLGRARTVSTLINKYSVDVNKVDGFGLTALSHAAEKGNVEMVSILLKAGAKAEVVDNNGKTSFFLAVTGSLPLEHLEFRSANKDKTFDRAKFRESLDTQRMATETATMLLEHGANLHHNDALGRNALSYVAASFLPDLMQFLIDKGIDIDEVDDQGRMALSHACEIGSTEAVRVLIKAGCDVVKADKSEREDRRSP